MTTATKTKQILELLAPLENGSYPSGAGLAEAERLFSEAIKLAGPQVMEPQNWQVWADVQAIINYCGEIEEIIKSVRLDGHQITLQNEAIHLQGRWAALNKSIETLNRHMGQPCG